MRCRSRSGRALGSYGDVEGAAVAENAGRAEVARVVAGDLPEAGAAQRGVEPFGLVALLFHSNVGPRPDAVDAAEHGNGAAGAAAARVEAADGDREHVVVAHDGEVFTPV